jgi:RNA polymerase subunit RPABC4/transcription elongation factor Spt4
MTDIQKEFCEEKGLIYIKPENTEIADYVNWLEAQIQALRIHDVVGRSEQLCPDCGNTGRRLPQTLDSPDGQECECGA